MSDKKHTTRKDAWNAHYRLLLQFVKREGHSRVPARHEEDGVRLGRWVHAQRQNRENLDEQRLRLLESLSDWSWTGQDAKWERGYRLLTQYCEREGHALVPKPHIEEDFALGVWVMHQRAGYRKSTLSDERIKRLDAIAGWAWYPRDVEKTARVGTSAPSRQRHVADIDIDELAEEFWKALFGLGLVPVQTALDMVASKLYEKGIVRSRVAKTGTKTGDLLCEVLDTAVEYGYMDLPEQGYCRAVLNNAEDYEPEDWRMCLFNSIEDESIERDDAIIRAAKWAKENLGLECSRIKKNGIVWKRLTETIENAVRAKELKQTVFYGVIKIHSLI